MRTLTAFFQIALAWRSAGLALPPIEIFPRRLSGNFPVSGSRHRNGRSSKAKVRLWLSFLSMPDKQTPAAETASLRLITQKSTVWKSVFPGRCFL